MSLRTIDAATRQQSLVPMPLPALVLCVCVASAAPQDDVTPPKPGPSEAGGAPAGFVEVFPGVRADHAARLVEFDAEVIADLSNPSRRLYLEVLACPRDTKEHESLLMTRVKPSQVHAALLLAGFTPGRPVTWPDSENSGAAPKPTPPEGDPVHVEFRWTDPATGEANAASPLEWVINAKSGARASSLGAGFVFAGSVVIKRANPPPGQPSERYDADSAGTLLGLASFGSETIAWTHAFSPESSRDEPVWIADRERVPRSGTKVVVRLTAAERTPAPSPTDPSQKPAAPTLPSPPSPTGTPTR